MMEHVSWVSVSLVDGKDVMLHHEDDVYTIFKSIDLCIK